MTVIFVSLFLQAASVPEEPVLEALLTNLASGLRELVELLRAMPGIRESSPVLASAVSSISLLASEICGECVPREYAPELKVWMDRIQQLASHLTPSPPA